MTDDDLIERAAKALRAHQFDIGGPGVDPSCNGFGLTGDCDWSHPWDRPLHEMWSVHREHVARAVLDAIDIPGLLAAAWDEGFKQGGPMHDEHYGEPDKHRINPYRCPQTSGAETVEAGPSTTAPESSAPEFPFDPDKKEQDRG